ncbi:MAG: DUF2096 domain-containing protein [Candidatus Bathyarchaeota archaeon]|nr:DUF2096 domain-containing protein [Candidatus Bathyarchaeota archaeon]
MSYEENWKVLADLLTELRKKGEKIPTDVMNDIRSAKTMIQILKADPTYIKSIPRIETYLRNVESYAVLMAQEKLGTEFVEGWLRKLEKAKKTEIKEKEEVTPRFVPGLPRDKNWVRVQISEDTPREDVESLVKENKLSCKMQKNGYMLVHGNGESIKSFVKKMAEKFRGTRKR